ncbi:winged helix DNA-binding protein [Mesorhizobium sp. B2-8-9]|uniref:winged helix DNA-binding protein n=1 Tax=Mesorhizobium sp. B2-8-9 TaxID=2589899 RepID=UPI001126FA7E|nr:winged helix DNA-binding protein [Mesorhizobium sp. B2-8-9]TPI83492.1 MarR family transcriptional regulator [Mesorhizobium sp. B2-8-9]
MTAQRPALRMLGLLDEFAKLDPEMQIQQISVFLRIVEKPDLSMRELEQLTGLSSSSVSRNVSALSKVHRKGQPGHDLVATYEDTQDRRIKRVKPTPKGMKVFNTLNMVIGL